MAALALLVSPFPLPSQNAPAKGARLSDFEGTYRYGPYREVVISVLPMGAQQMLLMADLQSDGLRLLGPTTDADRYTAGATFTGSVPAIEYVHFIRDSAANVIALERLPVQQSARIPQAQVAGRIRHRSLQAAFTNDTVQLKGTLLLPAGNGPFPAIVFAHGSEASDRHSFGPLPLALVAHGFAVLIYDKRGTGESTGSWRTGGIEPLGDDLLAGIEWLRRQPAVDAKRVGIFGSSEGGWVAAYAAAGSPDLHFVVTASGGALTKADAYVHKIRRQMESMGVAPASVDSAVRDAAAFVDSVRLRARLPHASGFDRRLAYDPTKDWMRFKGPVLHLEGEYDVLEPGPLSAAWYADLDRRAGHADATVKLFPRAHHSLLQGVTGTATEFESAEGISQMATGYWDVLLRWLFEHTRPER